MKIKFKTVQVMNAIPGFANFVELSTIAQLTIDGVVTTCNNPMHAADYICNKLAVSTRSGKLFDYDKTTVGAELPITLTIDVSLYQDGRFDHGPKIGTLDVLIEQALFYAADPKSIMVTAPANAIDEVKAILDSFPDTIDFAYETVGRTAAGFTHHFDEEKLIVVFNSEQITVSQSYYVSEPNSRLR